MIIIPSSFFFSYEDLIETFTRPSVIERNREKPASAVKKRNIIIEDEEDNFQTEIEWMKNKHAELEKEYMKLEELHLELTVLQQNLTDLEEHQTIREEKIRYQLEQMMNR